MIYYYFGSKEGLYSPCWRRPTAACATSRPSCTWKTWRPKTRCAGWWHSPSTTTQGNPDFIRLVMTENIHRGEYLAQSKSIQKLNVPAIEAIRKLYERGVAPGVFRAGLDPVDIHASISALSFFNVSNQHTFGLIFKRDTQSPRSHRRAPRQHRRDGRALRAQVSPDKGRVAKRGLLAYLGFSPVFIKLTSSYIIVARAFSRRQIHDSNS